jgi:hypothetical protein
MKSLKTIKIKSERILIVKQIKNKKKKKKKKKKKI